MIKNLKEKLSRLAENEPLAPYTTFKIGGPAKYFFTAKSADDMARAVRAALDCGVPFFVLAGGSNILVSDNGFDGLVILSAIMGCVFASEGDQVIATVGAGENWDNFVAKCVGQNLSGIECLSGIPGTVGAAPVQNIGAYGQSVDSVIRTVEAVDSATGTRVTFDNTQCEFGYRTSIFKKTPGRYIIMQVTFVLTPGGAPLITYHDLKQYFGASQVSPPSQGGDSGVVYHSAPPPATPQGGGETYAPSLAEVRRAVIEIRARKGYVIMPEYECYKTAGSFFMNPIITQDQFENLQRMIKGCPDPWFWPLPDGTVKVSAACLLQSAGFLKGYRRGRAGISPKHSLSLVNFNGASASDIVALVQDIKTRVREKFDIMLQEEVQMVGF